MRFRDSSPNICSWSPPLPLVLTVRQCLTLTGTCTCTSVFSVPTVDLCFKRRVRTRKSVVREAPRLEWRCPVTISLQMSSGNSAGNKLPVELSRVETSSLPAVCPSLVIVHHVESGAPCTNLPGMQYKYVCLALSKTH